jgi:G3E family GTPase
MPLRNPWIVVVGGLLGSGKASLFLAAARLNEQRGLRCAVTLNDQGMDLMDTRLVETRSVVSREVIGGCFCCRFSGRMSVIGDPRAGSRENKMKLPV